MHSPSAVIATSDSNYESGDSISEFEMNLRVLLPNLHGRSESVTRGQTRTTRKSEKKKKPSSRFNEEASFITEPPRSTKKKVMKGDDREGTSSKPCLISDWNNVQLANYYNACGISFTNAESACLNHLRQLKLSRLAPSRESASSLEKRVV